MKLACLRLGLSPRQVANVLTMWQGRSPLHHPLACIGMRLSHSSEFYGGIMDSVITQLSADLAKHAGTRTNGKVASERTKTAIGESLRADFRRL